MNRSVAFLLRGDIITDSQRWQIIVQKNISDYLLQQVKRIGKINVNLEEKNLNLSVGQRHKFSWIIYL